MKKNNNRFSVLARAFNRCAFIFLFACTAGLGFFIVADQPPAWLAAPASQQSPPAIQSVGLATLLSRW